MKLHVLEPGLWSTIQDDPRTAHARSGLPGAGPADPRSFHAARSLVGEASAAVVEIIGLPFTFSCEDRRIVAVTGRDVSLRAAARVPGWTAVHLRAGQTATVLGSPRYAYLAIAGGIALDRVLGSRATYVAAGVGPLPRPLRAGDELPLGVQRGDLGRAGLRLEPQRYDDVVMAVAGPHAQRLPPTALRTFFAEEFTVSPSSDRMGVRLEGPGLAWEGSDVLSCGVVPGAVQVPRGGAPIVLGPDAQTTGGYPVIAVVATAALGRVAQAFPGERLRFVEVTPDRAATDLRAAGAAFATI
ncbi:MAG: biotin-dependent carboxyltransferase family protein [Candidatus Limnocylindria bacterium]|nr:biotin-dependent carboxyltransferase [Chloroflexota bacterium]